MRALSGSARYRWPAMPVDLHAGSPEHARAPANHRPARSLARHVHLAVLSHRRVFHGGAGVRRAIRAATAAASFSRARSRSSSRRSFAASDVVPFSIEGALVTIQQVVIGVAMGFALQLVFDALAMGGQLLSNSMGLGFAFNVDPLRGTGTPVLGQLYMLLVTLTFLAINGHLVLIEILAKASRRCPSARPASIRTTMWNIASWGSHLFLGALMVALPGMTALLVVNSRSAS